MFDIKFELSSHKKHADFTLKSNLILFPLRTLFEKENSELCLSVRNETQVRIRAGPFPYISILTIP